MDAFSPLTIRSDALIVTVLPWGASLVGVRFAGSDRNLVLGFADPRDHARLGGFVGAVVGPVANRIRSGIVRIGDDSFQMPLNDGGNALHSGPDGLHARAWQVVSHDTDSLRLTYQMQDGCCGLPGARRFTVTYTVANRMLAVTLEAKSDRLTPINPALHPYWNLDGEGTVTGHELTVNAAQYLPTDDQNLPLPQPTAVAGTAFDFRTPRQVPPDPALDVNFCLARAPVRSPRQVACLRAETGTAMTLVTDAPGLQVYNGAHLPEVPHTLGRDRALGPCAGIALEPQYWPDALHHQHFPPIFLAPGSTFRQRTRFRLSPPR